MQLVVVPVLRKIQRLSFRVLFHCQIQELEIVKRLFKYTFGCSKMDIGVHQIKITVSIMITVLMIYVAGRDFFSRWHFYFFKKSGQELEIDWYHLKYSLTPPPPFFLLKGCRNEHKNTKFL